MKPITIYVAYGLEEYDEPQGAYVPTGEVKVVEIQARETRTTYEIGRVNDEWVYPMVRPGIRIPKTHPRVGLTPLEAVQKLAAYQDETIVVAGAQVNHFFDVLASAIRRKEVAQKFLDEMMESGT